MNNLKNIDLSYAKRRVILLNDKLDIEDDTAYAIVYNFDNRYIYFLKLAI